MTDPDGDSKPLVQISDPYKVLGKLSDVDGIGVVGNNTASNGSGTGVKGIAEAENGVGVEGIAQGYPGVETTNPPAGVLGKSTNSSGRTRGVEGRVDSEDGAGVFARATDSSGSADGLVAEVNGTGNAVVARGDVQVEGSQTVFNVGASAYLDSSVSIGSSLKRVPFDLTNFNDNQWYSTSNNEFTVAKFGDYRLHAQIRWDTVPSAGNELELVIEREDSQGTTKELARNVKFVESSTGGGLTMDLSRTVILGKDIKVYAKARAGSGTHNLKIGEANTYLTVVKVG